MSNHTAEPNRPSVAPGSYPAFGVRDPFYGLRIVTSVLMADREQFRFPRSKRKRIRKKWAKKAENWKCVPWEKAYQIGDTLHMHPQMAEQLRRAVSVSVFDPG
jgi:hypothetical protein